MTVTQTFLRHCPEATSGTALVIVFSNGNHTVMPWSRSKAFEALRQISDELARREQHS